MAKDDDERKGNAAGVSCIAGEGGGAGYPQCVGLLPRYCGLGIGNPTPLTDRLTPAPMKSLIGAAPSAANMPHDYTLTTGVPGDPYFDGNRNYHAHSTDQLRYCSPEYEIDFTNRTHRGKRYRGDSQEWTTI